MAEVVITDTGVNGIWTCSECAAEGTEDEMELHAAGHLFVIVSRLESAPVHE